MEYTVKIKEANKNDATYISLLGRVTFTETFGHYFRDKQDLKDYYDRTFSVKKIKKSIEKEGNIFWTAFVNDLPVGYAKLKLNSKSDFINSENICQLQKIYVLKDFLSMKIGYKLQNTLLEKAKELSFEEIWLSVLNNNELTINLYKKNNFKEIGNHHFKIGKENFEFIAMGKKLK